MLKRFGLFAIAAGVFSLTSTEAKAQAVVAKGDQCMISGVDAMGNLSAALGTTDGTSHIVRNGQVTVVICRGRVTNETGRAQNFSGIPCMVPHPDPSNGDMVAATDTRLTISASGVAVMRCRVKASDL